VLPDGSRLVRHRDHAGLRVVAPHHAAGGGSRAVSDLAVAVDRGHIEPAAPQLQGDGASDDAGPDDRRVSCHSLSLADQRPIISRARGPGGGPGSEDPDTRRGCRTTAPAPVWCKTWRRRVAVPTT